MKLSLNEYAISEVWGCSGAPVLAYVRARSAAAACVAYLRSEGFEARETEDAIVQDAEAPRVVATLVSRDVAADAADRTLARMLEADFVVDLSLATIPAPAGEVTS